MTKRINIGHYARVPLYIARAPVSEMAKSLWRELAFVSSPEKPAVWVRQQNFADKLKCCTRTIRRLIKELLEAKLIQKLPGKYQGRYVRYALNWVQEILEKAVKTVEKVVQHLKTTMSRDVGQEKPTIIKAAEQSMDKNTSLELLEKFGENWKKTFPCLDGKLGRPSLQECVEQGLNHATRKKYTDVKIYLDGWLRNASQRWLAHFNQNKPPSDADSMRAYEERSRQNQKKWFGISNI